MRRLYLELSNFLPMIVNFAWSSLFILAWFGSSLSIFETGRFDSIGSLDRSLVVAVIATVLLIDGYQVEKRLYKNSI
jgi:hypothetical protein